MKLKCMSVRPAGDNEKKPVLAKAAGHWGLILATCWVLLGVLGWLDFITGYELSFFVFYSVPVGVAAWYVGRWPAIGVALGATVAWLLADYFGGQKYSARFYYYWNGTIHFLAFIINAVTIAKIKSDLDQRHALAAELESARETVRALTALLPACPGCGRPRDRAGDNGESEIAALAREHPELAGVLCDECRANGVKIGAAAERSHSASSSS